MSGVFNQLIHAPTRLAIMALLSSVAQAEFKFVRDEVGISDSVLSKQIALLENAGYVYVKKGYVSKKPRTWFSITPLGRKTYNAHIEALRTMTGM